MQTSVEMSPNINYPQKELKRGPVSDLPCTLYTHIYIHIDMNTDIYT